MSKVPEYFPKIKELPENLRPRERLFDAGPEALSDAELIAILLQTGSKEESAVQIAHRLLSTEGGLKFLGRSDAHELQNVKGVGLAKAAQLKAAVELGRRIGVVEGEEHPSVKSPQDVVNIVMSDMRFLDREHFQILCLNSKNQVIYRETISIGSLDSSLVHPREVFKTSIQKNAAAIVLLHNHPSGDPTPSKEDMNITRRLAEAGDILGIQVLDHVIVGDNRYCSLKEKEVI